MQDRGFEIELGLSLQNLLKGIKLDDSEYQVIDCASREELTNSFEKIYSRLLYSEVEEDKRKVRNLKINLNLIRQLQNNQTLINLCSEEYLEPLSKSEFQKEFRGDYTTKLEKAIYRILKGELLNKEEITALISSDEIDLLDAFTFVYKKRLDGINEDFGDTFELNMYILKSLKLSSQVTTESGEILTSIDKNQYELNMQKSF